MIICTREKKSEFAKKPSLPFRCVLIVNTPAALIIEISKELGHPSSATCSRLTF